MAGRTNTCTRYPVSPQGDQIATEAYDCTWNDNVPFLAEMHLLGANRLGGSGASIHWQDGEGRQWTMFLAELTSLLKEAVLDRGYVCGWWRVRKRGRHYGLEYLGETYEVVA